MYVKVILTCFSRSVKGTTVPNIAAQIAAQGGRPPTAKYKSSAAPKGTKYADGYRDRALDRRTAEEVENDDRTERIAALEKSFKDGDIDEETFERLRDEITGGDISTTHLIKGLDRRLLERVRRGEDVYSTMSPSGQSENDRPQGEGGVEGVDEELEAMLDKDIAPLQQEKKEKKGQLAIGGAKRKRDAILAELKASRKAAAEAKAAQAPQLGTKFKRIGHTQESQRLEVDNRGREVLIIVDEDGNEKRKYRKIKDVPTSELLMPENGAKPLGMVVPEGFEALAPVSDEDDDIFTGVGAEYNPLAGAADDSDSNESDEGEVEQRPGIYEDLFEEEDLSAEEDIPVDSTKAKPEVPAKRNYFQDSAPEDPSTTRIDPMHDPVLLAALRKPRRQSRSPPPPSDPEEAARLKRRAEMLATNDRDMEDIDLGFGGSRFEDAEDMDERKIKLSKWKGDAGAEDEDDDDDRAAGGKKEKKDKRRRKRKGDKNSVADVMSVIEGRKNKPK
ncbi:hypothetical protein P152DRAFT_116851 [Eremomyces bilateralis CBS 781.70]|uniref:RED-like N-terminal domain-containing protein n=1 Tax=Eremomyces bilateralis CBS 781.70 TaxID=1392243 RepID=A0A6G1GE31_9PEZI|nr:uncharacterized protein P152DRAFT_116851 [Eremomyces bilateralis CBS 781.70]KAF1816292.1 hypothetical protein P152DRAFT_116851 [Eremomyces bilateralis CBS 781.70]